MVKRKIQGLISQYITITGSIPSKVFLSHHDYNFIKIIENDSKAFNMINGVFVCVGDNTYLI